MQAVSAEQKSFFLGRENIEEKINVPDQEIIAEQQFPEQYALKPLIKKLKPSKKDGKSQVMKR